ncbi:hypothetical protein D9M68_842660 [compost metagenome]
MEGPDTAGMARGRRASATRDRGDGERAALRERVFQKGRQPRARHGRCGYVRSKSAGRCRFRARSYRAQAGGGKLPRKRATLSRGADRVSTCEPRRHDGAARGVDCSRSQAADRRDGDQRPGCAAVAGRPAARRGRGLAGAQPYRQRWQSSGCRDRPHS